MLKDAYAKSQESDNISAKSFRPFKVLEHIGKNSVRRELPSHVKIHDVFNVTRTVPHFTQLSEISASVVQRPDALPAVEGTEYVVDKY